jgi:hypothetical protein
MKNRIEIDGVWYVKEETKDQSTISRLEPGIKYDGFVFESNLYAFDCTRIYDEDGDLYKDGTVSIKFTDKSKYSGLGNNEIEEHWDNVDWMRALLINEPEAIADAMESLCAQGMVELSQVLTTLKEKEWI